MARSSGFGHNRERKVKRVREAEGWFVIRAPASLGFADLVCLKASHTPQMVEVKGTAAGPYHSFGPIARSELKGAAVKAGADALLAYWPANGQLRWIPSEEWPL